MTLLLMLLIAGCARAQTPESVAPESLSPSNWTDEDQAKYAELNYFTFGETVSASGSDGMVIGMSGAPAVRAGLDALQQGGSAADAAMTTALAQVALQPGNFVTYAGIMTMVYYEEETNRVYSMNAAYNVPQGEHDPYSIPSIGDGIPDGRTVLVPGFMAGVEAAHERFGRLPFDVLFEPAIFFAEEGFELDPYHADLMRQYEPILRRLPETESLFTDENGDLFAAGDLFHQPELAATLRAVAANGSTYMYTGPWAEKLVRAVQEHGGTLTMQDMQDYAVIWSEPVAAEYGDYTIYAPGLPAFGGVNMVEGINLWQEAGLMPADPYTDSAESLFWLKQIVRSSYLSTFTPEQLDAMFPDADLSFDSRASRDTARFLWQQIRQDHFPFTTAPSADTHSSAIVAVDREGNIASVVHSINALFWGETGIAIDGVIIPDSAAHQQEMMAVAGAGNRLPDPTNPVIILRDGVPSHAAATIGQVHLEGLPRLLTMLDADLLPAEVIGLPAFLSPDVSVDGSGFAFIDRVITGEFDAEIINEVRRKGQPVTLLPEETSFEELVMLRGWWIGIAVDPNTGDSHGVAPRDFGGYALGY